MKKVVIASTNIGKVNIYRPVFEKLKIQVFSLNDFKIEEKLVENGNSEEENAIIKAKFYHEKTKLPVLANDSGLYIEKFSSDDQPGLLVRRYKGKELSDEELLNIFSKKLEEVGGSSDGYYNVGLAIIDENGKLYSKTFKPKRHFISKPCKIINKGLPLSSLAFDCKSKKYLAEMTIEERNVYEKEAFEMQIEFIKSVFLNN